MKKTNYISAVLIAILIIFISLSLKSVHNDVFEYCSTKAYGFPTPWEMNYCPCEGLGKGGIGVHHGYYWVFNYLFYVIVGITTYKFINKKISNL